MKIGLALGSCIKHILLKQVLCDEVAFIVVPDTVPSEYHWNRSLNLFTLNAWRTNPQRGIDLANAFRQSGKLVSPKVLSLLNQRLIGRQIWLELPPFTIQQPKEKEPLNDDRTVPVSVC